MKKQTSLIQPNVKVSAVVSLKKLALRAGLLSLAWASLSAASLPVAGAMTHDPQAQDATEPSVQQSQQHLENQQATEALRDKSREAQDFQTLPFLRIR